LNCRVRGGRIKSLVYSGLYSQGREHKAISEGSEVTSETDVPQNLPFIIGFIG